MSMATLQLYKNPYSYPHYSETITSYGLPVECTPVGVNLRTGTIRVRGDMADFMACNYMSLERDNQTIYAWIEDVRFHTDSSFEVDYQVDPWRTYKNKIDLGVQYIERRPTATSARDPLLGAEADYPIVTSETQFMSKPTKRYFVVQVRPEGGSLSPTPVQPSPYTFFAVEYDISDWTATTALFDLINTLSNNAETKNIVTMYSVPYIDLSGLPVTDLVITYPSATSVSIPGWSIFNTSLTNVSQYMTDEVVIDFGVTKDELLRVDHSVQVVIPDAGIIQVPDEVLMADEVKLRQDVDLFSGASNYMLVVTASTGQDRYLTQSVRGSAISSIPIVSDPYDTYMSQNQNALATSLLGDVATMAGGIGMATVPGAGFTGAGAVASGFNSMISKGAQAKDAGSRYSNPPAFLGTALAGNFNNRFWVVVTRQPVDNATEVHGNFGYAYGKVTSLSLPVTGYIKTENCQVASTDGSVPRWALREINAIFDNGIHVH